MGTLVSITLYAASPEQAQRAFASAFDRIEALNAILSDYKSDSELSRVCRSDAPLSPELSTVLLHSERLARKTDGAFDVTAKPVIDLWRVARDKRRLPMRDEVSTALRRSGYRKLEISSDGRHVRCLADGMQLDLGGIAKGYAADEALRILAQEGIGSALVAMSGDLVMSAAPPGRDGWRVRVQDQVLSLANAAVSTSGDEFQFVEIDGVRYSHIIDPRTGMALRDVPTVSVIAPSGIQADSLATALSVVGPQQKIVDVRIKPY
jgi:thiamine biosynthesis lipoprotein